MIQPNDEVFGLHDITNVDKYQAKISKVSVFLGISLERAKRYGLTLDTSAIMETQTVLNYLNLLMERGKTRYGVSIPNATSVGYDLVAMDETLDAILEESNLIGSVPMVEILALISHVDCLIDHYQDPGEIVSPVSKSLVQHLFSLIHENLFKYTQARPA